MPAQWRGIIGLDDPDTGRSILMANEEEEEAYGYRIGTIVARQNLIT